ncbi:extensin-like domain-containing protein [Pseudovibrio japonicus]|uniref:extensin-like domain-containing protein n=1 Tax=Pseudovibrio japonicus TaxID=366534 RepID=UPI001675C237|nr:extensin family protein [Pseudovibrio japonicus]
MLDQKNGSAAARRILPAAVFAGMCIGAAQVSAEPIQKVLSPDSGATSQPLLPLPEIDESFNPPRQPMAKPLVLDAADSASQGDFEPVVFGRGCALRGMRVNIVKSVNGPGACGMKQPVTLNSVGGRRQKVALNAAVQVECKVAQQLDRWVQQVAMPAARKEFGASITSIRTAAGYVCRGRNNVKGAKLSEHGKGNAVDIVGFTLSNGREVTVANGWNGSSANRRFIRGLHKGACEHFTTVLGPAADRYHQDHFHLDLACHGKGCTRRICR